MARIRTIKPEFFRHELLQDLEEKHGKLKPMLVFEGLWTVCDKNGVFEWRPRQLKLDILPFLSFNMEDSLNLLTNNGFIHRYEVDGKTYGIIMTFADHQRITGTEAKAEGKHPLPDMETLRKQQGNTEEADGQQLGRLEREKEREKERSIYANDFLIFWEAYPRKVGKDDAWKAWKKRNGSKPALDIIVKAIETQKKSDQWIRDGGQYIPNPATWINQGRWADEPIEQHPLKGKVSDATLNTVTALQDWRPPN